MSYDLLNINGMNIKGIEIQEELLARRIEESVRSEMSERNLSELKRKLDEARELIRNIIRVTWNEGWNYSLDWKVKAEKFLKENDIGNNN